MIFVLLKIIWQVFISWKKFKIWEGLLFFILNPIFAALEPGGNIRAGILLY